MSKKIREKLLNKIQEELIEKTAQDIVPSTEQTNQVDLATAEKMSHEIFMQLLSKINIDAMVENRYNKIN